MTAREFIYNLPEKVNPDAIEGMESTFHFNLSGENGGAYTVSIKDGSVEVEDGLVGTPKCTVTAKAEDMMGVVNKNIESYACDYNGQTKNFKPGRNDEIRPDFRIYVILSFLPPFRRSIFHRNQLFY